MAFIVNNWRQAISELLGMNMRVGYGNNLIIDVPFTSATWNTVGSHEILTVTGAVRILILPLVTANIAGATATLVLGDETTSSSLIASTTAANLALGEWWVDSSDTRTIVRNGRINGADGGYIDFVVGNGKDIGYTIGTAALTAGSIRFYVWWVPLSDDGLVVPGLGGTL
jgi:hypothetical protein